MSMTSGLTLRLPTKGHQNHPQHKEGCEKSCPHRDRGQSGRVRHRSKDCVFTPETGDRRNSAQGNGSKQQNKSRKRHPFCKTPHFPNILLFVASMDDGPCSQKQKALKKSVCHKMIHRWPSHSQPYGHDHIGDFRKSRVSQNPLNIVLLTCNQSWQKSHYATDPCNRRHCHMAQFQNRENSNQHINSGHHHRRRVKEGGNWRRPLH